jgi:prepilin-type N-terminal cleavage/methylation domain-containing protein
MKKLLLNRKKGFTLLEVLLGVVIISVLATLVIPRVLHQVEKAKVAEAVTNLGAIRSAELLLHSLTGKFVAADDEAGIESALGLSFKGLFYNYKIIDANTENFLAGATPVGFLEDWLEEIKIDKDGFVGFSFGDGSGGGGGGGGDSGGGDSGGGGGGSSSGGGGGGGSSSSGSSTTVIGFGITHGSSGGGTIAVAPSLVTDPLMFFPTNVTATPNDGWLHIGWDLGSTGSYNIVYRATKINGIIGEFQQLTDATPNDGWSDEVANGTEYCYQVTSYNETTQVQSIPSHPPVCEMAAANAPGALAAIETERDLEASIRVITNADGVTSGEQLVQWLTAQGTPVLYGRTSCSWVDGQQICTNAYQDPNTGTVVISKDFLSDFQKSAVLLSHEALHAIWSDDYKQYQIGTPGHPEYGTPPDPPGGIRSINSIDQEYRAFLTMYQVYYDLKKFHGMPDDVSFDRNMAKFVNVLTGVPLPDDSEAKAYLKSLYTDLSDY